MSLQALKDYVVDEPHPLIGAKTIQLLLLREVHDYTVLRTEDTRELNSVNTPLSESERGVTAKRVAFLGTKQKAAESRQMESILRTAAAEAKLDPPKRNKKECYLKDALCLQCPRCGLFGGSALGDEPNIKHRIEYSTAFSLLPFDLIADEITFNAVGELDQTTGQALGSRHVVKPATLFPSIVSLKAVTQVELILTVKTLLACKSYGAESRIGGDVRNSLFGIVAGWEELVTPLEFMLELYDQKEKLDPDSIAETLGRKYKPMAGSRDQIKILDSAAVDKVVDECAGTALDRKFLDKAYADVAAYRKKQGE